MASGVEDCATCYSDLPSIFDNTSSSRLEPPYNTIINNVNTEKTYQPIFGSFLLSDSDPLSGAAFAVPSSPSSEVRTAREQLMDNCALSNENNTSSSTQVTPSLPSPSEQIGDIDDDDDDDNNDEDDFDGIPIRHSLDMMKKKLNENNNRIPDHSNQDQLLTDIVNHIENSRNDYDVEDDSFLNGFTDEQHDTAAIVPSLFKDLPDIDDLNEHEEDNNNDDQVPFDHMDISNQSESLRSSSPDSLLSSSHLRDEQDDDMNLVDDDDDANDDEVAQWNDDHVLNVNTATKTSQSNPPLLLQMNPMDQVDFIDTSRSNSRCSDASSHLSFGYTDQARMFIGDNELESSSDSDDNDNNHDTIHLESDTFNCDDNENLCLQVNLDDHRSVSSLSQSDSTRPCSPVQDEPPIIDIDEEIDESKPSQVAPMAAMDDEGDDDLQTFLSDQPFLPIITSNIKDIFQLKFEQRKTEIVHDIVHMRHMFDENDHDDEFIAIMHNPSIFEQVLYDHHEHNVNDEKKLDLVKQMNAVSCTVQPSSQVSMDNEIKNESPEHQQNTLQTTLLSELNNKNIGNSPLLSSDSNEERTAAEITANGVFPAVAYYLSEDDSDKEKNRVSANVVDSTNALHRIQHKEQLQLPQTNPSHTDAKQITNVDNDNRIMSTNSEDDNNNSDDDDDDDLELLKTLSQFHGIVKNTRSNEEFQRQISSDNSSTNQDENSSEILSANIIINGNEVELLNKKCQRNILTASSPYVIDTMKNSVEEQDKRDEKKNIIIFHKNHNDDCGDGAGDGKQKEKYGHGEEEKKTTTFFSLTSPASPTSLNNDSHSTNVFVESDASSSSSNLLFLSSNKINETRLPSDQLITDYSQISSTKSNMDNLSDDDDRTPQMKTTTDLFDPFSPTRTTTTAESAATNLFDTIFNDFKESNIPSTNLTSSSTMTKPSTNYDLDDLWTQPLSRLETSANNEIRSNQDFDPNTFSWDLLINNADTMNKSLNPSNDNLRVSTSNMVEEAIVAKDKQEQQQQQQQNEDDNDLLEFLHWIIDHLEEPEDILVPPETIFTSTQNLESIVNDIQMCSMPFEPLPSPSLHVDHSVSNPLINAIHHELFPINEMEQLNSAQEQQSMTLYEEDEDAVDSNDNKSSSYNHKIQLVAEKLVSNILQTALDELHDYHTQAEQFSERILTDAVYEVYKEKQDENIEESETNEKVATENLATVVRWHVINYQADKQAVDPFDAKFDNVWISHFQTPNDATHENIFGNEHSGDGGDAWLLKTEEKIQDTDPMTFFTNTYDESDLFSNISNKMNGIRPEVEDEETGTLSEYMAPPILANVSSATMAANNLLKYTLTAPVTYDSGDDNSFQEDSFTFKTNDSSIVTSAKIEAEPVKSNETKSINDDEIEVNKQDNSIFTQNPQELQFEAFASDQPLDTSLIESKFVNITDQFDNEFDQTSTDDNRRWASADKTSETMHASAINNDEPWELEDTSEEQFPGIQHSPLGESDLHKNMFSDSFVAPVTIDQHSVNEKENDADYIAKHQASSDADQSAVTNNMTQDMPMINTLKNKNIRLESSTSDSSELEINDIKPSFQTNGDRIIDHMQSSNHNDVCAADVKTERQNESVGIASNEIILKSNNEDLPPPLPSLTISNDASNTSATIMPLKSTITLSPSNTNAQDKKSLRSESEIIPTKETMRNGHTRSFCI